MKAWLISPLADVFRDHRPARGAERSSATNLLADYAAEKPEVLADLLMDADEKQFAVIFRKFQEQAERGLPLLTAEFDRKLPPDATSTAKESLAKRQANAAATLFRLTQSAKVWDLLEHRLDPAGTDPTVRSYLIHRLGWLGVDADAVVKRLENEAEEVSIRRALVLSLGEYDEKQFSAAEQAKVVEMLKTLYRKADPGLHGAAEWLLRKWKEDKSLKRITAELAKGDDKKKVGSIKKMLADDKGEKKPKWYINGQSQTMVVIPGPVEYDMGSPTVKVKEVDHDYLRLHRKKIGQTFAIAATTVTNDDFSTYPVLFRRDSITLVSRTSLRYRDCVMARGGELLQLAQRARGNTRGTVVLRHQD